MDSKLFVFLAITLAVVRVAESRLCFHYKYTKCSGPNCSKVSIKKPCPENSYCYLLLNGTSPRSQVLLQGCWWPSKTGECLQNDCTLKPVNSQGRYQFCCCTRGCCNSHGQISNSESCQENSKA